MGAWYSGEHETLRQLADVEHLAGDTGFTEKFVFDEPLIALFASKLVVQTQRTFVQNTGLASSMLSSQAHRPTYHTHTHRSGQSGLLAIIAAAPPKAEARIKPTGTHRLHSRSPSSTVAKSGTVQRPNLDTHKQQREHGPRKPRWDAF